MPLSRREFCLGAAALAAPSGFWQGSERTRILRAAEAALTQAPLTIADLPAPRSPGGRNDYYSEADYWWPDPARPNGAYIRRDGYSNPDKFVAHRDAMIRLSLLVPALAAGWKLTADRRFADHAKRHLDAWFSAMNPNLAYAQRIIGVDQGRSIGIIDTLHLVEVARAADAIDADVKSWFRDYHGWLNNSAAGKDERDQKNNHGTCWLLQALQFGLTSGDAQARSMALDRLRTKILPLQIAADGSQPLELARTKPYSYSLFNLEVLSTIAHILGPEAWTIEPGLPQALAFMFPYIEDKKRWPYPPDVEYFADWPVRQVQLLFAGLALNRPDYIKLWRRLDPDPSVPEVVRNFPIRQPVLWLD